MRTMLLGSIFLLPVAAIDVFASATAFSQTVVSAQDSGLTATSSVVTASHVPVTSAGKTSFFDVSINLTPVLSGTTVTGLRASTKSSLVSPSLITKGFMPGTYMDSYGSTYTVGGGASSGNQTVWSVALLIQGRPSLYSATWDTDDGPNNPEYPLLQKNNITTTAYGFGASGGGYYLPADFNTGHLIGALASGNTITICSFEDGAGTYHNAPTACITLYFLHS